MRTKVLEVNVDDLYSGGVYSLVKNVIIHKNCGVKIDIAAIERFVNPENIEMLKTYGTDVYYVGYEGNKVLKQWFVYRNLIRILENNSYDCVHIHADVANKLLISGIAAKRAGVGRIILHSHSSGVEGKYKALRTLIQKICRIFLKYVGDLFVGCSDFSVEWMYSNIDKRKITIIKNGIALEQFKFDQCKRQNIRNTLKLKDEVLLGHVGRFSIVKNHVYMLDILEKALIMGLNVKLILIGDGETKDNVEKAIKKKQLEKFVILHGVTDHVSDFYHAMDVFILPSHFEGLPIVGIEAQAAGLPIIFSDRITRSAQLTDYVRFLGIEQDNLEDWARNIQQFTKMKIERTDAYYQLKDMHLAIQDTIENFLDLYLRT